MAALMGTVDTILSEVVSMKGEVAALLTAYKSAYGDNARAAIDDKLKNLKSTWS